MRLSSQELRDCSRWEKAGIELPRFDREAMIAATRANPEWVHFGAGNIFRAFLSALQQDLLDKGVEKTGIIVGAGYDGEIIDRIYEPYDNLSLMVTLKVDGAVRKRVLASVAEALRLDRAAHFERLRGVFRSPSLKMVSLTITEKGYNLKGWEGEHLPDVEHDFNTGLALPKNYIGKLAALCYERYLAGRLPLALVSMDNCSHNGDRLFTAVEAFATQWTDRGFTDHGFLDYIWDHTKVSFPWTMIDKITPGPDAEVRKLLEEAGLTGMAGTSTSKTPLVTPYVNAEETQYLVIEDVFPAGRLRLEEAGVFFTDRDTVDKVEKMKVCTCLNPLHTALAVFGCLLGYTKISDEMKNPDLVKLLEGIGYGEGLPVATDPGILRPREFIDQVLRTRLPNPFIPDTPQRIAADTSQKIPIRFGETIKAYRAGADRLVFIPLVLAAWIRYLLGVDDAGAAFTVSPDPLYETLARSLSGLRPGQEGPFHEKLEHILSDRRIFGVNLYESGLADTVERYFAELMAGKGAVAATLKRVTAENPSPTQPPGAGGAGGT
jgi:fructuronate reductase